ncbi:MAG: 50S ribosomal protein L9 [bacterium]|nr:50S ribosomal protein L9 [bacterium]
MKLILIKDFENLGQQGDVVDVARGYARNYLIPKKIGIAATANSIKAIEKQRVAKEKKANALVEQASEVAARVGELTYTFEKQCNEKNELYGSLTATEIFERLLDDNIQVERSQIIIEEPINKLGLFNVTLKLATGVEPILKIWVVREEEKGDQEGASA